MQKPGDYCSAVAVVAAASYAMALMGWGLSILDKSGRSGDMSRRRVSHRYSEFSFCGKSCIFITVP